MKKLSHYTLILHHLGKHGGITPQDALMKFGCQRLAPRIMELRDNGWEIVTGKEESPNGKHTTRYRPIRLSTRKRMLKATQVATKRLWV